MAARLKVYQASFGFRESVVAAANQKAALEAVDAKLAASRKEVERARRAYRNAGGGD